MHVLKKMHGNMQAADAAYNAGPNNSSLGRFAATGDDSGLFPETRHYIRQIQANLAPGGNLGVLDLSSSWRHRQQQHCAYPKSGSECSAGRCGRYRRRNASIDGATPSANPAGKHGLGVITSSFLSGAR